jgi:predicted porin
MKKKLLAAAIAAATFPAAYAVDMKAGDWTVSVGGNINAFYTSSECKQAAGTVGGLALGDATLACGGKSKTTVVGNGLLPSMLNVGAKSTQDGYDVSALIGIGVATATNSSVGQNNVVDVRNAYLTFGNKDMGTFKFGRDYGLFGLDAVLSDMTLLGVGGATKATQNGRVSLGHLAAGYTYAGTYGQMVYSSPSMGGFSVDAGVFNPVDTTLGVAGSTSSSSPALQARATFAGQSFKAWVTHKSQEFDAVGATPGFKMSASEIGGSVAMGPFGLVANYQSGNGIGMLSDGDQGDIKGKNTFVQATYKVTDRVKLGLGVGKSENDTNPGVSVSLPAGGNLLSNENTTAAVYFNLTKSLTLVGEVGTTTSKSFNGLEAKQNSYSVGGIFFF